MSSVCIGVDPGVSGALAFLACDTGLVIEVADMPLYEGPHDREVDTRALGELLNKYHARSITIEDVWGRPGNSAKSLTTFCKAYGALLGTLWYCRLPFVRVTPQKWQNAMFTRVHLFDQVEAVGKFDTKAASVFTANYLHPEAQLIRGKGRKPDHNRADAVCIARYGFKA